MFVFASWLVHDSDKYEQTNIKVKELLKWIPIIVAVCQWNKLSKIPVTKVQTKGFSRFNQMQLKFLTVFFTRFNNY